MKPVKNRVDLELAQERTYVILTRNGVKGKLLMRTYVNVLSQDNLNFAESQGSFIAIMKAKDFAKLNCDVKYVSDLKLNI